MKERKPLLTLLLLCLFFNQLCSQDYESQISTGNKIYSGLLLSSTEDSISIYTRKFKSYEELLKIPIQDINSITQKSIPKHQVRNAFYGALLGGTIGTGIGALIKTENGQFASGDIQTAINMMIGGVSGILLGGIIGVSVSSSTFTIDIDKKKSNYQKQIDKLKFAN